MAETDHVFTGSIPDIYDEYLVPLIFEYYARDLAPRAAAMRPADVLETAAGSGVLTRALAPLLDAEARYTVSDLNPPMLDRARRRQPDDPRLDWQACDALALPFEDQSFDVVCCQFGAMFFPDRVAGFREAFRTLRPGGSFIFNVWDHIGHNEFADCVTRTATGMFPDDPPLFLARTPHGYHDADLIRDNVLAAGFREVQISTVTAESRAADPRHPAVAYCQGTPLRNELDACKPGALDEITDRAAEDIARKFGSGPVSGKIQGHVIVAGR